jgi:cytochrome c553
MKKLVCISGLAAALLVAAPVSLAAGDAAAGKAKSATCAGCHGAAGISGNDLWPNLAGQKEGYLAKAMKDYRDGKRNDPMMSSMAKPLSDQDIADLAAYYASLK